MAIDYSKLKEIRTKMGLSQQEMAAKLGINRRTYSAYETGDRNMGSSLILKVCQTLGLSSDELLGNYKIAEPFEDLRTIRGLSLSVIPVFSTSEQFLNNEPEDQYPALFDTHAEAHETIAVKVAGDSMAPKIDDKDILTVRKQKQFRNGDIIAVILKDKKGIFIRRAYKNIKTISLEPINSEYDSMEFERDNGDYLIIGIVKTILKTIN
ncbi:MAG: LexA family transcriptional regulator [Ruminococcus sp.]|nr:LexA family transcriptional regulator [Ruminococcus sp.]